jgi:hypothetical protein
VTVPQNERPVFVFGREGNLCFELGMFYAAVNTANDFLRRRPFFAYWKRKLQENVACIMVQKFSRPITLVARLGNRVAWPLWPHLRVLRSQPAEKLPRDPSRQRETASTGNPSGGEEATVYLSTEPC